MSRYTIDNRETPISWECESWVSRALQNCRNLLLLRMGDVPYDRLRGLDPALHDRPLTEVSTGLRQEIERLMLWEPDVRVAGVRARPEGISPAAPLLIEVDLDVDD